MSSDVVQEFPLEQEYKKKTGISPEDVRKLRQWLATQPHLPAEYITDLDLILTYHSCDRSSEVSKQVLDLHFTIRTLFSFFKDRAVDDKVIKTLHVLLPLPLQMRSHNGDAIFYAKLIDTDPKNMFVTDFIRVLIMVLDLWQYEEGTWPGFILLIDLDGMVFGHLSRLELQPVHQFFYYLQETMLVKLKGMHFMNAPSFMDKLLMIIKPFMKKALLDVLHIHQVGSNGLKEFMPIDALPVEAGGNFKTLEQARDDVIAKLKANQDYFLKENKKRVVESCRPGKPKTISDIFGGVEGTFKKLDID